MISLKLEILGCDQLSSVPLAMQTAEHLASILQAFCLDINCSFVTSSVHSNVKDLGLGASLDNLVLDHRGPVAAGNVGLVLPVKHLPHLETAGGRSNGGRGDILAAWEGTSLPARSHGMSGGHVWPGVGGRVGTTGHRGHGW